MLPRRGSIVRIDHPPIRLLALLGVLAVCFGWSSLAFAAPSASPTGRTYLDTQSGHFNGPLRKEAGKTIPIYTRAPANARIEIIYWSVRRGELCPAGEVDDDDTPGLTDAQLSRATIRSFAPSGTATTGNEYYVSDLGPLLYGVDYCFYIRGLIPRTIEAGDQVEVSRALKKTMEGAWKRQTSDDYPPEECQSLAPTSARLCELRTHFASELPERMRELKVITARSGEPVSLPTAFEQIVREDESLFLLLDKALAQTAAWKREQQNLKDSLRVLIGDPSSDVTPLQTFVFNPLDGLNRTELAGFATGAEARRLLEATDDEPTKLLATLFSAKVHKDFEEAKPWEKTGGDAAVKRNREKLANVFVTSRNRTRDTTDPPPFVRFDEDLRTKLIDAGQAAIRGDDKPLKALDKELAAIQAVGLVPSYATHPAKGRIAVLRGVAESFAKGAPRLTSARNDFATNFKDEKGKPSPIVARLMKNVSAVRKVETNNRFAFEPDYQQRFPLYASGDAGIAVGGVFVEGQRAPRADVAAYFGINLYFTAVDKDEPLRDVVSPGRNFLRRFSIVGGISFIHPDINRSDLGLGGVLLDQVALTGVGFRVTDYLRLGTGAMYFTFESPNPISDREHLGVAPYLSVSIDVDVIGRIRTWRDTARGGGANPSR